MRPVLAALLCALVPQYATAQTTPTVEYSDTTELEFFTGTKTDGRSEEPTGPPTGPYQTYSSKITLTNDRGDATSTSTSLTATFSSSMTTASNATASTAMPTPTNTQPCNNHVELCTRKYSNISYVGAHNSPFVRPGNTGSNQELPVKMQLNDGVRFLQAQIQWPVNGTTPHFCHTSCDLLDAGPIQDWLGEVADWVSDHPYDVVTIMLGNGNYSAPSLYAPFIKESGILKHAYEAPYLPMAMNDWPTLENMIVHGKRVVMFMDYNANQTEYPWLHDEFAHMWETPFDPMDRSFPCTPQRPPDMGEERTRNSMYIMNHNLNVEFSLFGTSLLVPAVSLLNETNNVTGPGSLGLSANNCRSDWGRPPTILNVDYYNYGGRPGSVFEVAARLNNVTYDWNCCGKLSGAPGLVRVASWLAMVPVLAALALV